MKRKKSIPHFPDRGAPVLAGSAYFITFDEIRERGKKIPGNDDGTGLGVIRKYCESFELLPFISLNGFQIIGA